MADTEAVKTLTKLRADELIDLAIQNVQVGLGAQWLNFMDKKTCSQLEHRVFKRYLIATGTWSCGLWQPGDDIHLVFLSSDSENLWAEVVTEALNVEVGREELKEATKDLYLDLSGETVCHSHNGARTDYWYIKNDGARGDCRVVLHFANISPEWTDFVDLEQKLRAGDVLPEWPEGVAERAYEKNLGQIRAMQALGKNEEEALIALQRTFPLMRIWADLNNLTGAGTVTPDDLFSALAKTFQSERYSTTANGQDMLLIALHAFAHEPLPRKLEHECKKAICTAASESLKAPEMALAAILTAQGSLAAPWEAKRQHTPQKPPNAKRAIDYTPARFRTSKAVISRLRFDPFHAGTEYDVGYLDRFEGLRWMPLSTWGCKSTEEDDFIPEHRVRIIQRSKDSAVVWDRGKRIDRTGEILSEERMEE